MDQQRPAPVEEHLRRLAVEAARVGTFVWEPGTDRLVADESFRGALALSPQDVAAGIASVLGRVHPDDRERLLGVVQRAVGEEAEFSDQHRVVRPDGEQRWFALRGCALRGGDGVLRVLGAAVETTEVHRAQEAAERAARRGAERAALLARAADELGGPSGVVVLAQQLVRLVVPVLADWCVVSVPSGDDPPSRATLASAAWGHADRGGEALVARAASLRPEALVQAVPVGASSGGGPFAELLAGRPVVLERDAAAVVAAQLPPGPPRDALLELAPRAAVLLPLRGRDGVVGVLSCFTGPERTAPSGEDLDLLSDLAARAGLALEAARLVASQQRLAEALQRALLTAPAQPEGCEVVVRYAPATHAAQVGGDWYDAFVQPSGGAVLVIGDVAGHDTAAAAAMGQVRGMLRGLGVVEDVPPAALLALVDSALTRLAVDTTATALVARLERSDRDRRAGLARLRWATAGHPPPLVVDPGGRARVLRGRPGLLLGLEALTGGSPRAEQVEELRAGSTVLLCTDGLVERRDAPLDVGVERLRRAAEAAHGLPLEDLCDAVLLQLLPRHAEDDVALLALRFDG